MAELFVNNNGKIISADEYSIRSGSRAFLYGDGMFESIRIIGGHPINVENHFARILKTAKALRMRIPTFFTADFLKEKIVELVKKSSISGGGKCRVSIDRMSEGNGGYHPQNNEISFFIEVFPLVNNFFELNSKGLEVDIFQAIKKQKNLLANFKTKSALMNVMASVMAQEKELDDYLFVNENDNIIESSNSNLFIVSNGVLYTPGLDDGCVAGTMRMQLINIALENKIKVYESSIFPQNLLVADELFLTNAIRGLVWVGGYRTKEYKNGTTYKLLSLLNEHWKNKLNL